MRTCPHCRKHTVISDGYCGTCRQCTQTPLNSSVPLWKATLREKLNRLDEGKCLCGGPHGWNDDVMERGDSIPEIGVQECLDCGAIWDFGGEWPTLIRGAFEGEKP